MSRSIFRIKKLLIASLSLSSIFFFRYQPIHSSHYTTIEIEIPKSNDYIGKWRNQNPWTTHRTFHDYIPELIDEDDNEVISDFNGISVFFVRQ